VIIIRGDLPLSVTHEVRDHCLCLHLQRAARTIARKFDEALRQVGLSHGQFSLLISLNRTDAPRLGDVARVLGMDRTTLTANLKPLERRGLLSVSRDEQDGRGRRLALTKAGLGLLGEAFPIWRKTHGEVDQLLRDESADALREDLLALAFPPGPEDGSKSRA
jgi:DNA-binding MarR family transcriptional regulator